MVRTGPLQRRIRVRPSLESFSASLEVENVIPMIPTGYAIRTSERVQSVQVVIRNYPSGRVTGAADSGPRGW